MAEASRPWKPAVKLEPEETLASYVSNYSVVLTPTHVQKKRRVHSTNNMPGTMHIGRNQDKNMTLAVGLLRQYRLMDQVKLQEL
ncbi:unnamed protein product [Peronospora effusa]|nr:unnamed protein product [Peronospora effusa]